MTVKSNDDTIYLIKQIKGVGIMKKLLKKYEMQILKGLLLITVVGAIIFTAVAIMIAAREAGQYFVSFLG